MSVTSALAAVLCFKLFLTMVVWAIPMLVARRDWLVAQGFPRPEPELFMRLLGMAYLSLGVCYGFALANMSDAFPYAVVFVGIVSNGGAACWLGWSALDAEGWRSWRPLARWYMGFSMVATAGIAATLIAILVLAGEAPYGL